MSELTFLERHLIQKRKVDPYPLKNWDQNLRNYSPDYLETMPGTNKIRQELLRICQVKYTQNQTKK